MRSIVVIVVVAALMAVGAAGADTFPQGGGANNVVIAQTTGDGSSLVRSSTQVSQAGGPSVVSANIAEATATSCTGCDSTAVAVQVVLVTGNPDLVAPGNVAAAANGDCTSCGSFAYAWQYVLTTSRPVVLGADAEQAIAALRQELADAAAAVPPDTIEHDAELQARLDDLTAQLQAVVDAQVAQAGVRAAGAPATHVFTHLG